MSRLIASYNPTLKATYADVVLSHSALEKSSNVSAIPEVINLAPVSPRLLK